jgi:hypothetical protein
MAALECRAVGTVAEAQAEELIELLVGLSGVQPTALEQHEVVLRAPAAAGAGGSGGSVPAGWKPDLRLQHDLAAASTSGGREADSSRWAGEGGEGQWAGGTDAAVCNTLAIAQLVPVAVP